MLSPSTLHAIRTEYRQKYRAMAAQPALPWTLYRAGGSWRITATPDNLPPRPRPWAPVIDEVQTATERQLIAELSRVAALGLLID